MYKINLRTLAIQSVQYVGGRGIRLLKVKEITLILNLRINTNKFLCFSFSSIVEICEEYLINRLEAENAVGMYR